MTLLHYLSGPEHLRVYRADDGTADLSNCNAANLVGVLSYLDWCDDHLMDTGNYLSAFDVTIFEGYGPYLQMIGGQPRQVSGDSIDVYVGRQVSGERVRYSFSRDGRWKAKRAGSIHLEEVRKMLQEEPKSSKGMTFEEEAKLLEALFAERFPFS